MSLVLAQATLGSLSAFGVYALHVFTRKVGFWDLMDAASTKTALPDGTSIPESFTGVAPIDGLLKVFLLFFWPTVDGNHPGLSLACFLFVGQCVAALTLNLIEGVRNGNKNKIVSVTTVFSVLIQVIGFAVMGPLYLLLHLLTSPTVTAPTPANLSLDEGFLTGIPFGLAIGFIGPTIWMSLAAPGIIDVDNKILAILFWQASPIYAGVYASIWQTALWPKIKYANEAQARKNQVLLLRYVYKFGLALSATAHVATMTLSLSAYILPNMFSSSIVTLLQPRHVLLPPDPFTTTDKVTSIAQGAMYFIQWDYWISSLAYLNWALTLRYTSLRESFDLEAVLGLITRVILLGPMATALTYVWDRDEAVIGGNGEVAVPDSIKKIL